ncbi:alkaline phosphatase family protein [Flindersiella endophytica]
MSTRAATAGPVAKALLIGIDGFNLNRLDEVPEATNLRRLRAEWLRSETRIYPDGTTMTVSGPGWSTIATGVWPGKHGVLDNDFSDHRLAEYPNWLARAKQVDPGLTTYAITSWPPLHDHLYASQVDHRLALGGDDWPSNDRKAGAEAVRLLADGDHRLGFLYFGSLDETAHKHGSRSPEYDAAIRAVDGYVGAVLDTIVARETYAHEDWLILISTDHGHRPEGGHGGQTDAERSTFLIGLGKALDDELAKTGRMIDIAPTLLAHVGVAADPTWALDGRSLLRA